MTLAQFRDALASGLYFDRFVTSLPPRWRELAPWLRLYVTLLLLAALAFQVAYPVMLSDSDMWYHLDGGRWFWQHGSVPDSSFFSFIDPPRVFTNYYWGFQALLAALYEAGGYWALLGLRALLFFVSSWLAWRFIIEERGIDRRLVFAVLLFIVYFTFIQGRSINLRPHLFSHLFILSFLYILERRRCLAPMLPLITLVWANIHGIEYPVPALTGGAYFVEYLYRHRQQPWREWDRRYLLSLLACIPALLIGPNGIDLLATPFTVADHVNLYIQEMQPLNTALLTNLAFSLEQLRVETVFSAAFIVGSFVLLHSLLHGSLRLSHALMAIGGYILLSRGTRFLWEWALLMLPILTHAIAWTDPVPSSRNRLNLRTVLMALLMLLPIASLYQRLPENTRLPFDPSTAPEGVTRFLLRHGGGGRIIMPPSFAGYTQWSLGDRYKIFADLQMSLFNDFDIYRLHSFYRNKNGLKRLLAEYQPEFVISSLGNQKFPELMNEHGGYALVFFDDRQLLWASRSRLAELVEQYELKLIDPIKLTKVADEDKLDEQLAELERVIEQYPTAQRSLHAMVRLLFNDKRYDEAEPWARRFVEKFPNNPNSYYLLGDVYENTDRCEQAIDAYQRSMATADASFRKTLHAHIGTCYYVLKDFQRAYDNLWRGLNPFKDIVTNEDMFQLAFSAYVVGETDEALLLLRMMLNRADEDDPEAMLKAEGLLKQLEEDAGNTPSVADWLKSLLG